MNSAYLGLDCGTTSIKCLAVDGNGKELYVSSSFHPSISVNPGWIEQNPVSWIEPTLAVIADCVKHISGYHVKALAMSGHMSSPVFLDEDNQPLYNCMTVGDARCEKEAEFLIREFGDDFRACSNNKPMACFGAAKILWFKNNEPNLYSKTRTVICAKDFLRYCLTGDICTDPTDAGNMLLFDYITRDWNYSLIERIGLNPDIFPPVKQSMSRTGTITKKIAEKCGLPDDVAVYCGGADMACSNIGTASSEDGVMALTLSTSGQICMTVRDVSDKGYGKITFHPGIQSNSMYAMASVFSGGLALNWCYRLLKDKNNLSNFDFEKMAELSEQSDDFMPGKSGILFLPFLSGSGSPYFLSNDRSAFAGLSTMTDSRALFAAVIEGVCLHINENIEVFKDIGCNIKRVRLSGGGAKNREWVQTIANVTGLQIEVLQCSDASTLGAAIVALCAENGESVSETANKIVPVKGVALPNETRTERYRELYQIYKKFYQSLVEVNEDLGCFLKGSIE